MSKPKAKKAAITPETDGSAAAVWAPWKSLHEWPDNPRKNEPVVPAIVASIIEFGWGRPLVARLENKELCVGHTAWKAARTLADELKKDEALPENERRVWHEEALRTARTGVVPVRFKSMTPKQAHSLARADNRLGEFSEWDDAKLLRQLEEDGADLALLEGWDEDGIAELRQAVLDEQRQNRPEAGDEAPPVPKKPKSKRGVIYELGPHRLLCGDCRKDPLDKLMAGELADMVWTDPPYGVAYKGGPRAENAGEPRKAIESDDLDEGKLLEFLRLVFKVAFDACRAGGVWYVSAPAGPALRCFSVAMSELEIVRQHLVWDKGRIVFGRSDYHFAHEMILYGWKPGAPHHKVSDRTRGSMLHFEKPHDSLDHPTQKPVALVADGIRNSSKPRAIVLDLFGGSGTTLVASAQEGRRARVVELELGYCDVIRRRWGEFAKANNIEPGPDAL